MSYSLINHVIAGGSANSVTSGAIDTSGATLIVISTVSYNIVSEISASDVTDSKSNTWTPLTGYVGTLVRNRLFYCVNPTVGSGHTFTATKNTGYPSIVVTAWSGNSATPGDQDAGGGDFTPGPITPSEDNCLIISAMGASNAAAASINSGMTISDDIQYNPGQYFGTAMAYKIQTTAASIGPTWSGPNAEVSCIASFKAAAATSMLNKIMQYHG